MLSAAMRRQVSEAGSPSAILEARQSTSASIGPLLLVVSFGRFRRREEAGLVADPRILVLNDRLGGQRLAGGLDFRPPFDGRADGHELQDVSHVVNVRLDA